MNFSPLIHMPTAHFYEGTPDAKSAETIEMIEVDGGTLMSGIGTHRSIEARDATVASGMESGMRESYDRLDEMLGSEGSGRIGDKVSVGGITPFLWFDDKAEEAASFYVSIFENSRITDVSRYGEAGPGPKGSAMVVAFEVCGVPVTALNGGPHYKLSPAFSFLVSCAGQAEVDELWERLCEGGEPSQCGWLVDRYGLSWQIIPQALPRLISDPDPERANRAMKAMMGMGKIEVAELERAFNGG